MITDLNRAAMFSFDFICFAEFLTFHKSQLFFIDMQKTNGADIWLDNFCRDLKGLSFVQAAKFRISPIEKAAEAKVLMIFFKFFIVVLRVCWFVVSFLYVLEILNLVAPGYCVAREVRKFGINDFHISLINLDNHLIAVHHFPFTSFSVVIIDVNTVRVNSGKI